MEKIRVAEPTLLEEMRTTGQLSEQTFDAWNIGKLDGKPRDEQYLSHQRAVVLTHERTLARWKEYCQMKLDATDAAKIEERKRIAAAEKVVAKHNKETQAVLEKAEKAAAEKARLARLTRAQKEAEQKQKKQAKDEAKAAKQRKKLEEYEASLAYLEQVTARSHVAPAIVTPRESSEEEYGSDTDLEEEGMEMDD